MGEEFGSTSPPLCPAPLTRRKESLGLACSEPSRRRGTPRAPVPWALRTPGLHREPGESGGGGGTARRLPPKTKARGGAPRPEGVSVWLRPDGRVGLPSGGPRPLFHFSWLLHLPPAARGLRAGWVAELLSHQLPERAARKRTAGRAAGGVTWWEGGARRAAAGRGC